MLGSDSLVVEVFVVLTLSEHLVALEALAAVLKSTPFRISHVYLSYCVGR